MTNGLLARYGTSCAGTGDLARIVLLLHWILWENVPKDSKDERTWAFHGAKHAGQAWQASVLPEQRWIFFFFFLVRIGQKQGKQDPQTRTFFSFLGAPLFM
jgi:hypothetical protein